MRGYLSSKLIGLLDRSWFDAPKSKTGERPAGLARSTGSAAEPKNSAKRTSHIHVKRGTKRRV